MTGVTHAVTLRADWAAAVAAGTKTIIVRSWRPMDEHIGTRIGVHATHTLGPQSISLLACGVEMPIRGALVATAVLGEARRPTEADLSGLVPCTPGDCLWPLLDVERVEPPIPMEDRLGLWRLPA